MDRAPAFDVQHLAAIGKILGDSDQGLTGMQIAPLLRDAGIPDVTPEAPPWQRLTNAFISIQNKVGSSNPVVRFLARTMNPVLYTSAPRTFARRRHQLNLVLSACGVLIGEDGNVETQERVAQTSVPFVEPSVDRAR
jgi:hypothetical protein